jgi:hypothetical protein
MKKFSWGHGVIVALLAFMLFIVGMIVFFPMGKQNAEMVSDNYYEEELLYQQVIDAKNRADKLEKRPQYFQDKTGIKITFPEDINSTNAKVGFVLTRTEDRNLDIIRKSENLDSQNSIFIPAKVIVKGNYTLKLHWVKENKDYQIDYDVVWK